MAKLIGTGKDPRFPEGQDYDVNDEDLRHHVDAGLGEAVEPGTEAYASHRGYDTIAEDPGEQTGAGGPVVQENYGFASRAAARVETTSAAGSEVASPEAAVEAARDGAAEDESRGDVAMVRDGTEATGGLTEDQVAARDEQADAPAEGEDGPLPGEGGRGAEGARQADEDPADAPTGLQGGPENAEGDSEG